MTTETRGRSDSVTGGSFLTGPLGPGGIFTPERLSDEHRAIRDSVKAFVDREVDPRRDAVEARDYATHRQLLERLGSEFHILREAPEDDIARVSSQAVATAIANMRRGIVRISPGYDGEFGRIMPVPA